MTTLTKETLQKTLEILEKEAYEKDSIVREIAIDIKTKHSIGNFTIASIEREWYWSKEEKDNKDYYEVDLRHLVHEEVRFSYKQMKGLDRISWSSWSASSFKSEEEKSQYLDKSISYITAVSDMLNLMKDEEALKSFVKLVSEEWIERYVPLRDELYKLEKQIDEVKASIKEIDSANERQEALTYMVGTTRYFRERFEINNSTTIREIKIEQDKKRYYFELYDRKRTLTEDDIVRLYRHCKKDVYRREYNLTDSGSVFYKYPNEIDSHDYIVVEESEKTYITEEEWRSHR